MAPPLIGGSGQERPLQFITNILQSSTEYSIIAKDLDGNILLWNEGARRLYGYEPVEVVGKLHSSILHVPEDVAAGKPRQMMSLALELGKWEGIVERVRKNGDRFSAQVIITPRLDQAGKPVGFLLMSKDISEESLGVRYEYTSRRLSDVLKLSQKLALVTTKNELSSVFLQSACEIVGTKHGLVVGFGERPGTLDSCYSSGIAVEGKYEWRKIVAAALNPLSNRRKAAWTCHGEYEGKCSVLTSCPSHCQGAVATLIATGRKTYGIVVLVDKGEGPFRETDAQLVFALATQLAVTYENLTRFEQIQSHASAVSESNEKYASIVEGAPYGIYRADHEGRLLMVNPALAKMLGRTLEEMVGLNVASLGQTPGPPYRPNLRDELTERVWLRKDGSPINVRLSGREVASCNGQSIVEVFVENTTQQHLLERLFHHAQKMEAIGRLAGGVAHDFNNLLMVMDSFSQMVIENASDPQKVRRYCEQIRIAADRAARVTRQLLAFSRHQEQQLHLHDLRCVVGNLNKMLRRLLGEDIDFVFVPGEEAAISLVDEVQVEQVIMNLAINARDAMPNGGRLTIATGVEEVENPEDLPDKYAAPGRYATITVCDNGIGMDASVRGRMFEPFFTTKDVSKGTGLGLALVYGIVKQSNGYITVDSEPGQGTAIKIFFPLSEKTGSVEESAAVDREASSQAGRETILVVEDEGGLRNAISEFLQGKGYDVLVAADGLEALDICREHTDIDLLLTDVVMPSMTGLELSERVVSACPDLRVVYMSGYTERVAELTSRVSGALFLHKPFPLRLLAETIRSVLQGSTTAIPQHAASA